MKLTFVTGNKGKLTEWKRLLPADIDIVAHDVDLPEIQSLDSEEIVADKAKRAYEILKTPVVVEDVFAGLEKLQWLPGPFIKFFIKELGEGALHELAGGEGEIARVGCTIAYFDGSQLITASGFNKGVIVSPRGENGFGFDKVFMTDGSTKTYSEMTPEEKDIVSHRSKAIKSFVEKLNANMA